MYATLYYEVYMSATTATYNDLSAADDEGCKLLPTPTAVPLLTTAAPPLPMTATPPLQTTAAPPLMKTVAPPLPTTAAPPSVLDGFTHGG